MNMVKNTAPILPGATIGVLGGGQLGRMLAIEAKKMGYRVHVFSPTYDSPAGQVADLEIQADYNDEQAIQAFARHVDVITLEFENVPVKALQLAMEFAPVYPGPDPLRITQNRIREKYFLQSNGYPVTPFMEVCSLGELKVAFQEIKKGVLKTSEFGYDGKGQEKVGEGSNLKAIWERLDASELILESWVEFDFEFSVIGARNQAGAVAVYDPIQNDHRNHILDVSFAPAKISSERATDAKNLVSQLMQDLDYVGVLCVEFFACKDGTFLVNEIAPRPHNSGHLTIEAFQTSQFEQQLRAICGLPLGSTCQIKPAAMANLLGDIWNNDQPRWDLGICIPSVSLHLYGKSIPSNGRKMGHITSLGSTVEEAIEKVNMSRTLLGMNLNQEVSQLANQPN